jgi:hypothetical protein
MDDQDDGFVARTRGQETVRDMVLSLAVVMAGVVAFFAFGMPSGHGQPAVKVVDDTDESVRAFAEQAPYRVLAPAGLAADLWKPTSLRADVPGTTTDTGPNQATLAIGYVIDRGNDRTFAQYEVTNQPDAVQKLLGSRPTTGHVTIGGSTWDERDSDGHVALTLSSGGSTLIIDDGDGSGGASLADLTALASSLRPVPTTSAS